MKHSEIIEGDLKMDDIIVDVCPKHVMSLNIIVLYLAD